jgi:hypothetical protein
MSNAAERLPRSPLSERSETVNQLYVRKDKYGMRQVVVVLLTLLFVSAVALGQGTATATPNNLSGKYEGTSKTAGAADVPITLDLKQEGSKFSGRFSSSQNTGEITEGTFSEGNLTLKVNHDGKEATLTGRVEGEKITGTWVMGAQKGVVELKKVVPPATVPVAASPATSDLLSGDWDGVAEAGEPFPFLLTLKVDGEKVTGGSSSQLGESKISSGSWKDGKLNFVLDSSNGVVTMSATLVDGKLTGEFDYAGQMQGKWVAIKKKP